MSILPPRTPDSGRVTVNSEVTFQYTWCTTSNFRIADYPLGTKLAVHVHPLTPIHYARKIVMSPLEDIYQTRTKLDRNGTLLDQWNHELLHRDLERLISEGLVERVTNMREISPDPREKVWYAELATGNLYVYVAREERSGPEFRRYAEPVPKEESPAVQ